MTVELDMIQKQGYELTKELIATSRIKEEQILVVGCSSSEIVGNIGIIIKWNGKIGSK